MDDYWDSRKDTSEAAAAKTGTGKHNGGRGDRRSSGYSNVDGVLYYDTE
jgi:hypothetical protein